MRGLLTIIGPWLLGAVLAVGFWLPLARGAGMIGGDTYNYFLPLKTWYGDGLKRGELRLWHPHIGNGVPVLGESQTGALYPPYLLAYWQLETIPAYNAIMIGHYVFAFAAMAWLGRTAGFGAWPSLVGALAFVYGWFPARACLEWAIVTGSWLPVELACLLHWLRIGHTRWGWGLAASLCLQLLAGHFQLAWVSLAGLVLTTLVIAAPWRRKAAVAAFLALGSAFAAPQLLPTWEFKSCSVRNDAAFAGETRYGRLPPGYLQQLWRPWSVFAEPQLWLDRAGGDSNLVEAHFYFGLLPFGLAIRGLGSASAWRRGGRWLLLAGMGLLLATGVLSGVLQHLPGFGYFRYPGRYSLLAAAFGSLWIAGAVAAFPPRRLPFFHYALFGALLLGTLWELQFVGAKVCTAHPQHPPALTRLSESMLQRLLRPEDRVFAPDPNTAALFGAAGAPHYIGLEPALYRELWSAMPDVFKARPALAADALDRLRRGGITKLLTEKPLPAEWPIALEWSGADAFLNPRMGRRFDEPYYLYRFEDGAGRVRMEPPAAEPPRLKVGSDRFDVALPINHRGGRLQLTEWNYPGWTCMVDGEAQRLLDGDFLAVNVPPGAREAVFRYAPLACWKGGWIAAAAAFAGLLVELFRRRSAAP